MKTGISRISDIPSSVRKAGAALFAFAILALPAGAAPAAKSGDGTMVVSPAAITASPAGHDFVFSFRNANRGPFLAGSQLELTVPAGWSAPQAADPAAPGHVSVASLAGDATASVSSVSGSGPWTVVVEFTAGKGAANGFDLAYATAAPAASGAHPFPVRTRQAGGGFAAIGASPSITVAKASATVTLGDLLQTWDGTPRTVAVATDPAGLAVDITYNGAPEAPRATGMYAVVATVADAVYEGSASGTLVVRAAGAPEPVIGLETFENFAPTGSSYESGAFLGQDGSVWTYAKARGDLGISGRSPTLEKAKEAFLRSGTIPGGVGAVTLKFRKAGSQNVACGVFVNGVQAGTISGGDGSVQTWTSGDLNVAGRFTLMFSNNVNAGAITLDDVEWTPCKLPAAVTLAGLEQTYDGAPRTVAVATEPAGLAVDITYAGAAAAPVDAGAYAVVATVVDADYAGSATGMLVVAKAGQAIDFPEIGARAEFQALGLAATASSGLPVAFAVVSGPASIAGGTNLAFSGTGTVEIAAAQPGDGNWAAAADVVRAFTVVPGLELSGDAVNVREAGDGRFFVRLGAAPAAAMTATVARVGGDAGLRVKGGATLVFGPANWNWWQTVTLAASNDADTAAGAATFRVALAGCEPRMVAANALDDDIGENLALATNGATIAGGYNAGRLIDGVHATSANYGFTVWTNEPPGTMTLTLKAASAVSRIRLLNWDWLYPVLHRYQIEGSLDGTNWTRLVDAAAEGRHGWDDWEVPEETALRFLRFTGLANTANALVCVAELEVYGRRLPAPAAVTLRNLRQVYDGTPRPVAVETDPPALPVEVLYDAAAPAARAPAASNRVLAVVGAPPVAAGTYWVAAEVVDEEYEGSAEAILVVEKADQVIAFPNPGTQCTTGQVDLAASTSSGLPVSFAVAAGPAVLDGTGARLTFTGTGTVSVVASQAGDDNWNPAPDASVTFDVECPGLCVVLSKTNVNVREGGEGRFFVKLNSAPAAPVLVTVGRAAGDEGLAVRSGAARSFHAGNWNAWQVVTLAAGDDENAAAETAVFTVSLAGAEGQSVAATTLDDDLGENLALASGGATIKGRMASQPALLIDGMHTNNANYGYTIWTNEPPGTMTLDLKQGMAVSRVRLLNWDWAPRFHRYTLESSVDGTNWAILADATLEDRHGWDDWPVADETIRYLRFTGLSNSANQAVLISELEVYGTRPAVRAAAPAKGLAPAVVPAAAPAAARRVWAEESEPVQVLTSDGPEDAAGWNAVDGDPETAWTGQQAGGGYVVIEYAPVLKLTTLDVYLGEGSLANAEILYSLDARDWRPLPDDLESNPVELKYLWVVFPDDGTADVPQVLDIVPNG